jgi:hypothetical protein
MIVDPIAWACVGAGALLVALGVISAVCRWACRRPWADVFDYVEPPRVPIAGTGIKPASCRDPPALHLPGAPRLLLLRRRWPRAIQSFSSTNGGAECA